MNGRDGEVSALRYVVVESKGAEFLRDGEGREMLT